MGIVGGNLLRTWEDGTLPDNFDPSVPQTSKTLKALAEKRAQEQSL